MRRVLMLASIATLAATASIFIPSAAAVSSRSGATIATFSDSVGEVAGGPDITTVTVSLDGDVLTVMGQVTNMPQITSEGTVIFLLNTDSNMATGQLQGADYALFVDTATLEGSVMQWNGSDYVEAQKVADPSRSVLGGSEAGFMFNLANLGSPKHIEFAMIVAKGAVDGGLVDMAPDAGLWAFDAVAPAPAPAPPTPAPAPAPAPAPVAVKPVIGRPAATPAKLSRASG